MNEEEFDPLDDEELEEGEENCEWCHGTGLVDEDEYENGQLVGRGTLSKKCICRMQDPDDYPEDV